MMYRRFAQFTPGLRRDRCYWKIPRRLKNERSIAKLLENSAGMKDQISANKVNVCLFVTKHEDI